MADAQRTIDLIFNGVDRTGAATLSALSNAEKFSTSLKNITQPISDFTVGAVKLEVGLLAAGLAMTTFAVKAAADFDTNFRQISTIVNASDEDLNTFKASILSYAQNSTQPLEGITAALGAAIGSGVDYADSLELLAAAEKLSVATRADLQATTKVLVSTMNSYGVETDQVGRISDVFFKIIDDGDISMNDLAESFAKVAPVAKIAGVPIEELGAAIATLTAAGIKPAEAIEAVRAAISNILAPSKEGADLAETLGINFNAAGLKAEGFAGIIGQVAEKTGGNAEQMKILFGSINGFTAAATLAGPQATNFANTLESMKNAAGATDAAFAKVVDSVEVAGAKIGAAFNVLLVSIGQPLLDEFGGVANAIAAIFIALGASVRDGELKDLVAYIEGLFDDLQVTLAAVAKNLPAALASADFSGFKGGIDAVVGAFKNLFGSIDLTSVEGLKRAIELAGLAFMGLSKFTAGVIESFKPLFDLLVKVGGELDKGSLDFAEAFGNIGGAVVQINLLLGGINGLIPVLNVLLGLLVANQGLSLVGAVRTLVAVLPGFTLSLQAAGAAAAGVFAADSIIKVVGALLQLKDATDKLKAAQERGRVIQEQAGSTLERFAATTGIAVDSIDAANKLVDDGTVVWSTAANGWVLAGDAMADAGQAAADSADPFGEANRAMLEAAEASEKAAAGSGKLAGAQKDVDTYTTKIVKVFDAATGKVIGYEHQLVKTAGSGRALGQSAEDVGTKLQTSGDVMEQLARKTNLTNAELIDLAKAVKSAEIELEKIASNERIKNMEARVTINVAQIEADTKRIEAAFESINVTIDSTAELLGDLFGLLAKENLDWSALRRIEDQIDLENKRRQEALDLQKRLTEAMIAEILARTRALEQGDGLIKVDGAGLQPHLEAFMWEILRTIQVRVNADGLSMLLGV